MSARPGTDAELVARARGGDLVAFDRLIMRHRGRLYRIAQDITGCVETAQDVVQDALLRAFRALDSLRDGTLFGPWINTIVRRESARWLRDGRGAPELLGLDDAPLGALLDDAARSQEGLAAHGSAEAVNSGAYDCVIRMKHSLGNLLSARLVAAARYPEAAEDARAILDDWRERNRLMAENIVRIAAQFRGTRIVVTTGAEHRYMLRDLLAGRPGITLKEFWEVLPDSGVR